MPAGFRPSKRVGEHQDQRVLFIVAASRRSVHLRGLVGRRSQTPGHAKRRRRGRDTVLDGPGAATRRLLPKSSGV